MDENSSFVELNVHKDTIAVAVAAELGVHERTVGKWRHRFVKDRLDGLSDEPRPGRPRTLTDDRVAKVVERTLATTPADATPWSLRSMAKESGLSHTTIWRIWGAFGLQPHRAETFKLSSDPHFVDKVRDNVGLYLSPPDRALVLCAAAPVHNPAAVDTFKFTWDELGKV